jgi:hypothetical protein
MFEALWGRMGKLLSRNQMEVADSRAEVASTATSDGDSSLSVKAERVVWVRRAVTAVLVVMMAMVVHWPASAASVIVRGDPNDTRFALDIRNVWTDRSSRDVFLRIGTWDRWRNGKGMFLVQLDTHGSKVLDVQIEVLPGSDCLVERPDGHTIGTRQSHRPDHRTIKCRMPARWFHIHKVVRFQVKSDDSSGGLPYDRAPNKGQGRFVGL